MSFCTIIKVKSWLLSQKSQNRVFPPPPFKSPPWFKKIHEFNIYNEFITWFHDFFFSLLETSCEQDDNFPSSVCVKVNGRLQTLPNPIPTNKPGVEPKRPPKPIDITALCKLSSTVPNFVNVTWAVEVRIYILKVRNSTNYGCFANYRSQNIKKYFPFIFLSRTCSSVHVFFIKLFCTNSKQFLLEWIRLSMY